MDVMNHEGFCDVAYQRQEEGWSQGAEMSNRQRKKRKTDAVLLSSRLYLRAPSVQEISVFVRGEFADGT